jgi:hypothetical protein
MGYAERIYEQLKRLPEPIAREVLDFAEFMAARQSGSTPPILQAGHQQRRSDIEQTFAKYQIDLSRFRFDREEANARR